METYKRVIVVVSLILGISFSGCSNNLQISNEKESKQMQEEIENLKSELNVLKDELAKKESEYQTLLNESCSSNDEKVLDLSYVSINKNRVNPNISLINEYGLDLDVFCKEVWAEMNIEILDYSKKEFGDKVPTKFKVSLNGKSIEFEGVVYASSANGEPIADYIAGKFGNIRARYKRGIRLNDKGSISDLFELLGIGCTFYDDKSIDIYKIEE